MEAKAGVVVVEVVVAVGIKIVKFSIIFTIHYTMSWDTGRMPFEIITDLHSRGWVDKWKNLQFPKVWMMK